MENQVLQFPEEKAKRVLRRKKVEGQRLVLVLSLFSFVLIAVLSNEQVMRDQRPLYLISDNSAGSLQQMNRAIASAQPMDLFRDVEWEHQLAKRLAVKDSRRPASVGSRVTLWDHLRFGTLAGKYRITSSGSALQPSTLKIREIEYIDSTEITDRPVQIHDSKDFLMQYRSLAPVEFGRVVLFDKKENSETWSMISTDGHTLGQVKLDFDAHGHFLKMQYQLPERAAQDPSLTE